MIDTSLQVKKKFTPGDYERAAAVAQEAEKEMLSRLQWVTLQPKTILEVGCGTGSGTKQLRAYYPNADIYSTDIVNPMLKYIIKQSIHCYPIQADTYQLPFKTHSIDLLVANFLLPWCHDIKKIFAEWRRVLQPQGLLMFTSLGPDTMKNLQHELGNFMLPNLIDMHDIGDALLKEKFTGPVMDTEYITLNFDDANKMLNELQASEMLINEILPQISHENVTVDFEIIYGHAWGAPITVHNVANEEGVVKIPIEQLRNRKKD